MKIFNSCLIGLLIVIALSGSATEKYTLENFTRKNGLFHSTITGLSKDSLGYLWIATGQGVQRYDGYYFETYKESKGGLANEFVNSIYTDTCGTVIWFGTYDGNISRYDILSNKFRNYQLPSFRERFTEGQSEVRQIQRINDSILLVFSMPNNLVFLNEKTGKTKNSNCFENKDKWFKINMFSFNFKKEVYFATNSGIYKGIYKNRDVEIVEFTPSSSEQSKGFDFIRENDEGNWYGVSEGSFYIFSNELKQLDEFKIFSKYENLVLTCIEIENEKNVWLGSKAHGLFKIDLQKRTVFNLMSNKDLNSLVHNNITRLFYTDGFLWVGTFAGISKIDLHPPLFRTQKLKEQINLNGYHLWMIFKDNNGCIWITVNDSLVIDKNNQLISEDFYNKIEQYFIGVRVYSITEDLKTFWIGSSEGLIKIDKESQKILKINLKPEIKGANESIVLRKLYKDEQFIWLMYPFGLGKYNVIDNSVNWYYYPEEMISSKNGSIATSIIKDTSDNLWFGLNHIGLCKFDTQTEKFTYLYKDNLNSIGIPVRNVLDIHLDSKNKKILWIGTYGYGMYKYNFESNEYKVFRKEDGLENERVYQIIESSDSVFWLSTDFGISKFNNHNEFFSNYNYYDGIEVEEFNMGAGFKDHNGNIYFGGVNGYVNFNPTEFVKPFKSDTRVCIEKILIGNKIFKLFPNYNNNEEYKIPGLGDKISFFVSVINFSKSEYIQQKVILKGYDDHWQYRNAPPFIYNYKNLPEGDYEFIVKTNNRENFNYPEIKLKFTVVAPWYKSLAFRVNAVFFFLGLIALVVWLRIRYLNAQRKYLKALVAEQTEEIRAVNDQLEETNKEIVKQNAELEQHRNNLEQIVKIRTHELKKAKEKAEESDRLKSSFLANLSHEIRTPMNSIIGFSNLMESEVKQNNAQNAIEYVQLINENSNSLLKLINDIIDLSLIEAGDIVIEMRKFDAIELLAEIYHDNIDKKTSEIDFLMDISGHSIHLNSDRIRVKQILNNFINNAFKFTKKGIVEIGFNLETDKSGNVDTIVFWVKDTGIGIKEEDISNIFELFRKIEDKRVLFRGTGVGLRVSNKLSEMLDGKIHVKSEFGKGSVFYLELPVMFNGSHT